MRSKFDQLPTVLKLIVIWFFMLGLNSFWRMGSDIETRHIFNMGSIIYGSIWWGLGIGLINKSNESREWAISLVVLSSFVMLFALATEVLPDPNPTKGVQLKLQTSMTHSQTIIFLVANLILNAGTIFTLLRPVIKEFFTPQTNQENKQ